MKGDPQAKKKIKEFIFEEILENVTTEAILRRCVRFKGLTRVN